jgi:hypothetical protein
VKSYSAPILAALANGVLPLVTFIKIAFPSGTVALNDSNYTFTYDGTEYRAALGLGQISPITDGGGDPGGIKLELVNFDSSNVALALDDADEVQGSAIEIRTAILDKDTLAIIDAPLDWAGYADTMSLGEDGKTGSIAVSAENKGVDLLRGNPLVYNDADQRSLYANDDYFEYVVSQSDKPVPWPTKEALYQGAKIGLGIPL